MAVQSIRAAVQVGNVAGDHLLVAAGEMAFGKVNFVRELHNLAKKIRPRAETFDDAGDLAASGAGAPEIVSRGNLAASFSVFGDSDFRGIFFSSGIGQRIGVRRFAFFIG
jgi:hypothetical protein